MARITKAMLEAEVRCLTIDNNRLRSEVRTFSGEIKMMNEIIRTYQGMTSLTIAMERITDALTQTLTLIENGERRREKSGK